MDDIGAFLKAVVIVALFCAIVLAFIYGVHLINERLHAERRERSTAVIVKAYGVTSKDAALIFEICQP
jgi:hypothetical protein